MKGEGHYVAFCKRENHAGKRTETKEEIKEKSRRILEEFMKQVNIGNWNGSRLDIHGERIYYMPEGLPDVRGIRFLEPDCCLEN